VYYEFPTAVSPLVAIALEVIALVDVVGPRGQLITLLLVLLCLFVEVIAVPFVT
jgi:hypothetical protein